MITLQALDEAIAECQGVRDPDAHTCMMLAAFLTIRREMYPEPDAPAVSAVMPRYSLAAPEQAENIVTFSSGTEFSSTVNGMAASDVWPVMDELMETLQYINRRLYESVLRELRDK